MPSWLIELQGEVADANAAEDAQGGPVDWLSDLAASTASDAPPPARPEPFADPSWLSDLGSSPPAPEPGADQGDQQSTGSRVKMPVGATDWLRSMGHDPDVRSEPLSEPISTPEDQSGVPEWLRDLSDDDVARGIESDVPDSQSRFDPQVPGWLTDDRSAPDASTVSANFRGQPTAGNETSDQLPDWLRGTSPADADEAPPARRDQGASDLAGSAEMPAWLRDLGESAPTLDEPSADDEPAWLREAAIRPPTDRLGGVDEVEVPAWLRGIDEPAPPAQPSTPPPEADEPPPVADDEMPSWLRESAPRSDTPAGAVGAPPPPRDDAPAWLQESEPAAGEAEVPSWLREAEAGPPSGGGLPAWLQEPEAPTGGAEPAAGEAEVPSWLREAEAGPPAPASEGALPAWLQDSTPAPSNVDGAPSWLREIEEPAPAPPSAGDVPAWLQDDAAAAPDPTWLRDALADPAASPTPADVPPWLQEAPGAGAPPPADVPPWLQEVPGAGAPPPADVPPWLQEAPAAPPPPGKQPPAGDLPPWLVEDEPPADGATPGTPADPGLPSWLRGVADEPPAPPAAGALAAAPPPPPRQPLPGADQGESHSFLSGAELPSWLRVPEPERPADTGEGQALDWLRRLGTPEDDEPLAAAVATVAPQWPLQRRSDEQLAAVALLQRISRAPYPEPAVPVAPAPLTRWQRIGIERVLYGLLALALLLALVVPAITEPFQTPTPTAPGAAELNTLLDSLGSEDVALVAYEWGAQRSGELRPLEEAVTRRLIASRTKLILLSTDLQGTLLSFDLIRPLRAAGYNNEDGVSFGGRDYVLLGYRPGGELALRSLAQDLRGELQADFDGQDATQGLVANNPDGSPRISSINDLSLILVLADQPQDVQAWMEQVRPAARDVPLVFLLPQEAQPQAQPYLRLPNVYHVAGQQGALALLASDPSSDPSVVARATGQLWYAVAVFLVLLVVGAVVAAVTRRRSAQGGGA